jgi:hypothetical protein
MVLGLAQAGIHVVATAARERTEIEAVAEEVRQSCGESRILPLVADVTQEDDCAEVVNVNGPFMMARHAVPVMLKAGWGRIVNVSVSQGTMRRRGSLLDPSLMVPPLLWLVSPEADGMTGRRLVATKWQTGSDGQSAAEAATEQAG